MGKTIAEKIFDAHRVDEPFSGHTCAETGPGFLS